MSITIALFDDNKYFIEYLSNQLSVDLIVFPPNKVSLCFTEEDVKAFVEKLRGKDALFLINLECRYGYEWRINLLGIYFFRCLIKELGSSNNFQYYLYSFLSIDEMRNINDYSAFIKKKHHIILPFNFRDLIDNYGKNEF